MRRTWMMLIVVLAAGCATTPDAEPDPSSATSGTALESTLETAPAGDPTLCRASATVVLVHLTTKEALSRMGAPRSDAPEKLRPEDEAILAKNPGQVIGAWTEVPVHGFGSHATEAGAREAALEDCRAGRNIDDLLPRYTLAECEVAWCETRAPAADLVAEPLPVADQPDCAWVADTVCEQCGDDHALCTELRGETKSALACIEDRTRWSYVFPEQPMWWPTFCRNVMREPEPIRR